MSKPRRAPFIALPTLLQRRFPDLPRPEELIREGRILVDGAHVRNPRARVRVDAAVRVLRSTPLRGSVKLAHALAALAVEVTGHVALDVGAAAGGFTQALLDSGARRVYALDAGVGQLRGHLRLDPRVVNLERTNLSQLKPAFLPEPVEIVTMDLTYLSVSKAVDQLDARLLVADARLLALVKPTYELRSGELAAHPVEVDEARRTAERALRRHGWRVLGHSPSPLRGANGAVETFVLAERRLQSADDAPRCCSTDRL